MHLPQHKHSLNGPMADCARGQSRKKGGLFRGSQEDRPTTAGGSRCGLLKAGGGWEGQPWLESVCFKQHNREPGPHLPPPQQQPHPREDLRSSPQWRIPPGVSAPGPEREDWLPPDMAGSSASGVEEEVLGGWRGSQEDRPTTAGGSGCRLLKSGGG
ncbi:uncharacterized protein LOC143828636 [Paroedura picta]|uniref:uncharacterized protein LOC143828636 n=1 Tax=Paroedura picta TaxID=143630 RepID=UPI004055DC98